MAKKAKPDTIEEPEFDEVLDPTTRRCVDAMREVIDQLVRGDGKVGLTEFTDSASAPAEGRYATRELQITIVQAIEFVRKQTRDDLVAIVTANWSRAGKPDDVVIKQQ